jgi:hypothetical protein
VLLRLDDMGSSQAALENCNMDAPLDAVVVNL